jgi:hypothetical protein
MDTTMHRSRRRRHHKRFNVPWLATGAGHASGDYVCRTTTKAALIFIVFIVLPILFLLYAICWDQAPPELQIQYWPSAWGTAPF